MEGNAISFVLKPLVIGSSHGCLPFPSGLGVARATGYSQSLSAGVNWLFNVLRELSILVRCLVFILSVGES